MDSERGEGAALNVCVFLFVCPLVLPIYHSLVTGKSPEKVTLDQRKHMASAIDSFACNSHWIMSNREAMRNY